MSSKHAPGQARYYEAGSIPPSVAVGDFDDDGKQDLAVANSGSNTVSILTCPPGISIDDVVVSEGNSGTTNAVFTLNLYPSSTQTVTVNLATADGTAPAGPKAIAGPPMPSSPSRYRP